MDRLMATQSSFLYPCAHRSPVVCFVFWFLRSRNSKTVVFRSFVGEELCTAEPRVVCIFGLYHCTHL